MKLVVVYVGQARSEFDTLMGNYITRVTKPYTIEMVRIKPAGFDREKSIEREERELRECIASRKPRSVYILDEHGTQFSTRDCISIIEKQLLDGGDMMFIIGGSYGLNREFCQQYKTLALSKMTLPHEFARLILIEQLYRSVDTIKGGNYHHQ